MGRKNTALKNSADVKGAHRETTTTRPSCRHPGNQQAGSRLRHQRARHGLLVSMAFIKVPRAHGAVRRVSREASTRLKGAFLSSEQECSFLQTETLGTGME